MRPQQHSSTYGRGGTRACSGRKPKGVCGLPCVGFSTPRSPERGDLMHPFRVAAISLIVAGSLTGRNSSAASNPLMTACVIHSPAGTPFYTSQDGGAVRLTPTQCGKKNDEAAAAVPQVQQTQKQYGSPPLQLHTQAQSEKEAPRTPRFTPSQDVRGYKRVSFKDVLIDEKYYVESGAKIAVTGLYKSQAHHHQRLYASYNDFMMHMYQSVEASYIGLISEDGTRSLREYLMQCSQRIGCELTILGHVSSCTATNAFGALE